MQNQTQQLAEVQVSTRETARDDVRELSLEELAQVFGACPHPARLLA